MSDEHAHEPSEVTYAEYFHPARPKSLRYRTRVKQSFERHTVKTDGQPNGTNPAYVSWLLSQSMLADANTISRQFSGQGSMWQNPFANPDPRHAVESASVWFTAYPISLITRPGESFLASLGDEELWKAFATIGINALHTGPVKRAGGLVGWRPTPSVDGHFDRISTKSYVPSSGRTYFEAIASMCPLTSRPKAFSCSWRSSSPSASTMRSKLSSGNFASIGTSFSTRMIASTRSPVLNVNCSSYAL